MEMEFNTTKQEGKEAPEPPEGKGWSHTGAANAPRTNGISTSYSVYHYWQRPKTRVPNVCRKCRALAFKDGKCVGCDTPLED